MDKKRIGILAFSGLLLVINLFIFSNIFNNTFNGSIMLFAVLSSILTAISLSLVHLFIDDYSSDIVLTILSGFAIILFFPFSLVQIINFFVVVFGILLMRRIIKSRKKEFIHFSYYLITKRGISIFFLFLILFLSINTYVEISNSVKNNPDKFYSNIAEVIVKSSEPILKNQVEGFSQDMTVDEFLVGMNIYGVLKKPEPKVNNDPAYSEESMQIAREQFSQSLGLSVTGKEQIGFLLKSVVQENTKNIFKNKETIIPLLYTFIIFFSLRLLAFIISWIATLLGSLFFALLVKFNVVNLRDESVIVQTAELK